MLWLFIGSYRVEQAVQVVDLGTDMRRPRRGREGVPATGAQDRRVHGVQEHGRLHDLGRRGLQRHPARALHLRGLDLVGHHQERVRRRVDRRLRVVGRVGLAAPFHLASFDHDDGRFCCFGRCHSCCFYLVCSRCSFHVHSARRPHWRRLC